jgi:hypothetical protein
MKKRILTVGGVLVVVFLLAGAAFVSGQLLNRKSTTNGPGLFAGGEQIFEGILPAKELPQTPAEVFGFFDHRQDKSIFIVTGQIPWVVNEPVEPVDPVDPKTLANGPIVEIVVTSQTTIYRDVTSKQFNGPPPSGQKPQQVVEPGSLDEIAEYSTITVWGRKTGDRFIADVLVYTPPEILTK